jgi:hypothetical protein
MATYTPFDSNTVTYTPSTLFVYGFPVEYGDGTILSGEGVVVAGTVLGIVTASGKMIACAHDAVDGSQIPVAVSTATVDATSADASVVIAKTGRFDASFLIFGGTSVVADLIALMEARNLYPITVLDA